MNNKTVQKDFWTVFYVLFVFGCYGSDFLLFFRFGIVFFKNKIIVVRIFLAEFLPKGRAYKHDGKSEKRNDYPGEYYRSPT